MISVIIPTYNSEQYIDRCLESIQNQSYSSIEIIVIDDASTDNTVKIVESKMSNDARIHLIKLNKNSGSSVARQNGIMCASGNLITFVDADDWYSDLNALKKIVSVYDKTNVDCVMYGYRTIHKYGIVHKKKFNYKYGIYTIKEVAEARVCFPSPYWHYLWNKCFRAELLKSGKIMFDPELRRAQDVRFNEDLIRCANSFYVMKNAYFYNYNCCNINQITRKKSNITYESELENFFHIKEELYRMLGTYKYIEVSDRAIDGLYAQCFYKLTQLKMRNRFADWNDKLNKVIEDDDLYSDCVENLGSKKDTIKYIVIQENIINKIKQIIKNIARM